MKNVPKVLLTLSLVIFGDSSSFLLISFPIITRFLLLGPYMPRTIFYFIFLFLHNWILYYLTALLFGFSSQMLYEKSITNLCSDTRSTATLLSLAFKHFAFSLYFFFFCCGHLHSKLFGILLFVDVKICSIFIWHCLFSHSFEAGLFNSIL